MAQDRLAVSPPIRLSFRSEQRVVVEPDDKDRFIITMREAAQACQQAEDNKEWEDAFQEFLVDLEQWGESHSDRVRSVYVYIGDGTLNILVGNNLDEYDSDLDDTLSDLDISLVQKFPWLVADVMQIPGEVRPRIPFEKAILVYGDGKRTSATGPA